MDGDPKRQQLFSGLSTEVQEQGNEIILSEGNVFDVGNVLSPFRLRRIIQIDNGRDRFVLGCRYNFLLYFRIFLFVLYIAYSIFK